MASVTGAGTLPAKTNGWLTSQGRMSEAELNQAVRAYSSPLATRPWVDYDEQWVKWNSGSAEADALYHHVQRGSRHLEGAGSTLRRDDLLALRAKSGEPAWTDAARNGA